VQPKWHPKKRAIAVIWVAVFGAAFAAATVFQDNDPNTDDGAGYGALAFIAGVFCTAMYIVYGAFRQSRLRSHEPAVDDSTSAANERESSSE
jgi:tryptophan-rich sensory protein